MSDLGDGIVLCFVVAACILLGGQFMHETVKPWLARWTRKLGDD